MCKCVLYFCHRVTTQLQLTNISYFNVISKYKFSAHKLTLQKQSFVSGSFSNMSAHQITSLILIRDKSAFTGGTTTNLHMHHFLGICLENKHFQKYSVRRNKRYAAGSSCLLSYVYRAVYQKYAHITYLHLFECSHSRQECVNSSYTVLLNLIFKWNFQYFRLKKCVE